LEVVQEIDLHQLSLPPTQSLLFIYLGKGEYIKGGTTSEMKGAGTSFRGSGII
jgi:hypothetical protein